MAYTLKVHGGTTKCIPPAILPERIRNEHRTKDGDIPPPPRLLIHSHRRHKRVRTILLISSTARPKLVAWKPELMYDPRIAS